MGLFFKKAPAPEPPQSIAGGILEALQNFDKIKGTLMLINNESGSGYSVLSYDKKTGRAKLKGNQGEILNPRITEREDKLYSPLIRD